MKLLEGRITELEEQLDCGEEQHPQGDRPKTVAELAANISP